MQRNSGVQGLVFGALMAALVVVFSLVPILSIFIPIPLVLTYIRYGGRTAVLTSVVAVLFTMGFSGFVAGLLTIPGGILPGLVFGYGLRHNWRPLTIGIVAVLVFFLGYAMEYGVTRVLMFEGRDPIAAALEAPLVKEQLDQMVALMEQAMVPQLENPTPQQQQAVEQSRQMLEVLRKDPVGVTWTLLPTSLFLMGVLSTWINYMLCRATLPRFGHKLPAPTPFSLFRLPIWLVWVYGILMLLAPTFIQSDFVSMTWWAKLLLNVFTPLQFIIALAGLAVAYGFLRRRGTAKGASVMLVIAAVLLLGQMGMQLLILLAMWDTVFDFRGLGHGLWKRPEGSH